MEVGSKGVRENNGRGLTHQCKIYPQRGHMEKSLRTSTKIFIIKDRSAK
jgi:hypothetical protein